MKRVVRPPTGLSPDRQISSTFSPHCCQSPPGCTDTDDRRSTANKSLGEKKKGRMEESALKREGCGVAVGKGKDESKQHEREGRRGSKGGEATSAQEAGETAMGV